MSKKGKNSQHKYSSKKYEIKKESKIFITGKKVLYWIINQIYAILYVIMLIVLWIYLIMNWDKCISMQFFDQFDGNNILFIVGIVLTVLPFYNIEGKEIKFSMRKANAVNNELQSKLYEYTLASEEIKRKTQNSAESDQEDNV